MATFSLKAVLSADGRGLFGVMNKAGAEADKLGKKFGSDLKTQITAAFTVGAILAFTKSIVDMGGEIQDTAKRLNISTDAVQEFRFAAKQSGSDMDAVASSLDKLANAMEEVKSGSESGQKIQEAFERLGVSLDDIKSKTPEQIFRQLGATLEETNVTSQVSADIMDVLGKSGTKLIPTLKELADNAAKLKASGDFLTKEDVAALDEAGDKLDALALKTKVFGAKAGIGFSKFGDLFGEIFKQTISDPTSGQSVSTHQANQRGTIAFMEKELARRKAEAESKKPKKEEKTQQEIDKEKKTKETEDKKSLERAAQLEADASRISEENKLKQMSSEERLQALLEKRIKLLHTISVFSKFNPDAQTAETLGELRKTLAETESDITDIGGKLEKDGSKSPKKADAIRSDSLVSVGNFLGSGANAISQMNQDMLKEQRATARNTKIIADHISKYGPVGGGSGSLSGNTPTT